MPFVPSEPRLQRRNPAEIPGPGVDGEARAGAGEGVDEVDEGIVWTVARLDPEGSDPGATQDTSSGLWSSSGDAGGGADSDKGKSAAKQRGKQKMGDSRDGIDSERSGGGKRQRGALLGGMKTVAIRNVEAGPFVMEVWVERNEEGEIDDRLGGGSKGELGESGGYKSVSVEDE